MIDLAVAGQLDGICSRRSTKPRYTNGGPAIIPDEHQMFAKLTGHAGFFGEMNVIPEFATFRVTSHVALRRATDTDHAGAHWAAVHLADGTLRAMGHDSPRIGVAALNPHCGENGLFGDEEIRIIRPAVDALRAEGIVYEGPSRRTPFSSRPGAATLTAW